MHPITRKLFFYQVVLLAGCSTKTVQAGLPLNGTVSLPYIARLYSMRMTTQGKKVVMVNKYNKLEIETNSRYAWINGVKVWLHEPCRKSGSSWGIKEADFKRGIDCILRSYAYVPKRIPKLVVLDPGHGGSDPGAAGPNKLHEKTVVLDISHRVRKHLE
ncbi:MAG: N-acetylmuramoyl-L-alanine amidase, partial [Kiritimatiellaceae bacterium]|nr:N-acetylmuramoyl-L-alanine amidase [Kiritimatiellaceae bacterium]